MLSPRTLAVARWEFLRFTKVKDLVIGTLIFAVLFGAGTMFGEFTGRKLDRMREIAVLDAGSLGLVERTEIAGLALVPRDVPVARADSLLVAEELDAALVVLDDGSWQLRVRRERSWMESVRAQLTALVQQARIAELGLAPEQLAAILVPPDVQTVIVDPPAGLAGRSSPVATLLIMILMMMGLFVGFSYVFVAITGEKTQRTTESLLSALHPQEWIDGKILGLTGVVLVNLASAVLGYLLWSVAGRLFFGQQLETSFGMPPLALAVSVLLAALGFFFWFTFFAMIAATIDDPNSSARSSFMFLPFLPMSLVFGGIDTADALWMRVLSVVPGISPIAMPARLMRGEPAWWEIVLAVVLLALAAWWFRRAAGRIFGTSMLMTGKEPNFREVWRWLRESAH
jgi:ABC-2 type transport system permease protein